MACGRDDGASTPCARTGGARPIRVCGSVCVGDKVEREKKGIWKVPEALFNLKTMLIFLMERWSTTGSARGHSRTGGDDLDTLLSISKQT